VGIVPRLVLERSPLRPNVRMLPLGRDAADLGEFHVGVCTARRKLASPLVRAFWDSLEGGDADAAEPG
jgi:LysR family positive regulator for ilvC